MGYKSSGSIRPHMHEAAWSSGSVSMDATESTERGNGNHVAHVGALEDVATDESHPKKAIHVETSRL